MSCPPLLANGGCSGRTGYRSVTVGAPASGWPYGGMMAADYEQIREENIRRYGWDTAVLDLLGQLYSERTHFIFELIQNAEDAGATELRFGLFADRLEVRHDGRPFTEADVRGVCGVGQSAKAGDLTTIGRFGIGFKSVYAYTTSPRIHSGAERFGIESYVRPFPVAAADGPPPRRCSSSPSITTTCRPRRPRPRSPRPSPASTPGPCCSCGTSSACGSAAPARRSRCCGGSPRPAAGPAAASR